MKRIIMLFLGFVIAGYIEGDSLGQDKIDSALGNKLQAQARSEADAKAAVSRLIRVIRSKDVSALEQVRKEIEATQVSNDALLSVLKDALRDPDPDIKFMALFSGFIKLRVVESLLDEIITLISDKDVVVRYLAVSFLAGTDSVNDAAAQRAIPALIEYLRYEFRNQDIPHTEPRGWIRLGGYRLYDRFREDAARALAKIGPRAVPALTETLHNDNVLIREGAARALGEIGPAAKQAAPLLLSAIKDKDNAVRFRAAVALWKVDRQAKPVLPILIEAVQSPEIAVGIVAAVTLGEMGSEAKEAVPVLAEVMKIDRHIVSSFCARALGKIGPEARAAIPALLDVLRGEDDLPPKLPETIHDRVPPSRPPYLKPKYHNLRFAAAEALWRVDRQHKVVVPILIKLLKEDDHLERLQAAELLGEIGPAAIAAVPELLNAAKDSEIRDSIVKALKKIDPNAK